MDTQPEEPYFEWVPDDLEVAGPEDIMEYALRRVEAEWHQGGWDQPFTMGIIFHSNVPELGAAAMSVCVAQVPDAVVADPDTYFMPFAKLVAQAVWAEDYKDDDFQRVLMQAALGHPDQDLEAPRTWLRQVLGRGGVPLGWFSIVEGFGFEGAAPPDTEGMDNDQIRALPGIKEERILTFLSKDRYQMSIRRTRGSDEVEVKKYDKVEDVMGFALGLLTSSSLRMRMMMDDEARD